MANQFQPLLDAMESGVKDILNQLIDGAIEDLEGPVKEISARLAMAARRSRSDLVQACKDQLELIVLENQLKLEMQGSGMLETVLNIGIDSLIGGAVGGLGSLRQ